ncbi:MAG: type II toxin-antitoxin system VapB family antitoxin [Pseudomonadota bacterium]
MAIAKVFMSGRSQAVRLPKEFRVNTTALTIEKVGESLVLTPINAGWDDFFAALREFGENPNIEREQPREQQERDWWPEE